VFLRVPTVGITGVGVFKAMIVPMAVFLAFSPSTVGIVIQNADSFQRQNGPINRWFVPHWNGQIRYPQLIL
jgi:hypothetical protein